MKIFTSHPHFSFKQAAIFLLASVLLVSSAQAATTTPYHGYTSQTLLNNFNPRDDLSPDAWKVEIAPYFWALGMSGSVQIRGRRAPVEQSFSDILNELNWAGMVWVDAHKNKFGVFLNALYASLSNGASDRYISAHVNNNFGLYSAGLSYEIYKACLCTTGCHPNGSTLAIEPYIGARYTVNNISLTVNTPLGDVRASNDKHWTDPMVGTRLNFDLTKTWLLTFAGDVGGTNASSDYSYNVYGIIGYKPQAILKRTTWYLGYRLLDQHYSTGSSSNYFNWNMKLYGPLAGVSFTF